MLRLNIPDQNLVQNNEQRPEQNFEQNLNQNLNRVPVEADPQILLHPIPDSRYNTLFLRHTLNFTDEEV